MPTGGNQMRRMPGIYIPASALRPCIEEPTPAAINQFFQIGYPTFDRDDCKASQVDREAQDQQKSENELWDLAELGDEIFPTELGFDTFDDSDNEPVASLTMSRQSNVTSGKLEDSTVLSDIGNIEPIPMRRSPSSLHDNYTRPSMAQSGSQQSFRNHTDVSPLTLRRQNAIAFVSNLVSAQT